MAGERPTSINPDQQRRLKEWLDAKATRLYGPDGAMHCPLCNSPDFRIGNLIAAVEITDDSGTVSLPIAGSGSTDVATGYAMVPLRCGNCAYVMLFHAGEAGIADF